MYIKGLLITWNGLILIFNRSFNLDQICLRFFFLTKHMKLHFLLIFLQFRLVLLVEDGLNKPQMLSQYNKQVMLICNLYMNCNEKKQWYFIGQFSYNILCIQDSVQECSQESYFILRAAIQQLAYLFIFIFFPDTIKHKCLHFLMQTT